MFSINQPGSARKSDQEVLYIPLCFLLIKYPFPSCKFTIILYIPLCFLLIGNRGIERLEHRKSLHSTMFSINLFILIIEYADIFLYIPLCFLLISYHDFRQPAPGALYIPLCFLLIMYFVKFEGMTKDALHSTMFSINQEGKEIYKGM